MIRDARNIKALREAGWNVIVIWECDVKNKSKREETVERLAEELRV
jgi:DNA mismatch endonuclease (patch repair protein)